MPSYKLQPVKDPKKRTVLVPRFDGPCIIGEGDIDFTCPSCGALLAEGLVPNQIWEIVIDCPACHSLSRFADMPKNAELHGLAVRMEGRKHGLDKALLARKVPMIGTMADGKLPTYKQLPHVS